MAASLTVSYGCANIALGFYPPEVRARIYASEWAKLFRFRLGILPLVVKGSITMEQTEAQSGTVLDTPGGTAS